MTLKEQAARCWNIYYPQVNFYSIESGRQRKWIDAVEQFKNIFSEDLNTESHCEVYPKDNDWNGDE